METKPQPRLNLKTVLDNPGSATFSVSLPPKATLSPLAASQEEQLAVFFDGLSPQTRRFYSVTDGRRLAHEHCAAIARYDKLRLVLQSPGPGAIVALVEFSFDLTADDVKRFASHGVDLRQATDCRWGLCVMDEWQRRGVGAELAPPSFEIARRFGRKRIILWGGVHVANSTALRYYRKVGFIEAGRFMNNEGVACVDMLRELGKPSTDA